MNDDRFSRQPKPVEACRRSEKPGMSFSGPIRFAFLDESLHALLLVGSVEQVVECLLFLGKSVCQGGVVGGVDQPLCGARSQRGA
jgi:hypothetical protein